MASGVVPQISLIMGPCAGGAVYSPAMTDFIFMVKDTSYMFVTGPEVVKTVTHEEVTAEELGGAVTHTTKSGVADLAFENDVEALMMLRRFINFLPLEQPREAAVPADAGPGRPHRFLARHAGAGQPQQALRHQGADPQRSDDGDFFELQPDYAKNIVIGFGAHGRLADGRHRRQPAAGAGRLPGHQELDQGGALRALLRRLQHPGGHLRRRARLHARHRQEYGGIIKHGAKLLYAYAECTVPKVT
jgi:propionyl-CoA carboxylase beta chain